MLYGYGFGLGLELLAAGRVRSSLRYLAIPVNYWRCLEYRIVLGDGDFSADQEILDIGSPKLLSVYLAERVGARVYATDILDHFVPELDTVREVRGIPPDRLRLGTEDGRSLSLPDESVDRVYSISVLEHIADTGDSDCAREIGRVLRPGGRCVLTVPFAPESREEYRRADFYWSGTSEREDSGDVFYQRRYSEADLHHRIVAPSGLRLRGISYWGEFPSPPGNREIADYLPRWAGPVQPLLSRLMHTGPAASWHELDKPLAASLVLDG